MTNEQYLEIKERFPESPTTAEEFALLHDMIYRTDNTCLHMSGPGFVSIRYPEGEIFVFETLSDHVFSGKFE